MGPSLLLAQMTTRTSYELARLQSYTERWQYLVLIAVCAAIAAYAIWMIRRDSIELRPAVAGMLALLRVVALVGLLAFYLNLEKRTERKVVHNSRVLLLVDTSLSMGLHDLTASAVPAAPNRLEQVVSVLDEGKLIDTLRAKHDVTLFRFDSDVTRVSAFPKLVPQAAELSTDDNGSQTAAEEQTEDEVETPTQDWRESTQPQGTETRLGQSLRRLIAEQRSSPIAGIVIFSDGGQNAGVDPSAAVAAARDAMQETLRGSERTEDRPAPRSSKCPFANPGAPFSGAQEEEEENLHQQHLLQMQQQQHQQQ